MEHGHPQAHGITILMNMQTKTQFIERRAELMTELFLEGLQPRFVARVTNSDFVFDFLISFLNTQGGINTFAVKVKSTEQPVNGKFNLQRALYKTLANSNLPVLLLVVDVKQNQFYYAWPHDNPELAPVGDLVRVPVSVVDDETIRLLLARMAEIPLLPAGAMT